jgi:hypothetical protein
VAGMVSRVLEREHIAAVWIEILLGSEASAA